MWRKTFIRLVVLGTLAFSLFFVLVSAKRAREVPTSVCTELGTKAGNKSPSGELIIESLIGSVLVGIK